MRVAPPRNAQAPTRAYIPGTIHSSLFLHSDENKKKSG